MDPGNVLPHMAKGCEEVEGLEMGKLSWIIQVGLM